jgi:uncharacterized membrane protein
MRLFGDPVHPMLVHFPIAFWSLGTLCDGLALLGFHGAWPQAWLFISIGLAAAVPAMIAGAVDFAGLEMDAVPAAMRHMMLMGTAWTAYLAAFVTRSDGWAPVAEPGWLPIALGGAGFAVMAAGARYGGHLVYRFGAGMEPTNREG